MSENILEVKGLSLSYGKILALDGLDLQLPRNSIVGLLGPNGSGKTTLIKACSGLLRRYTGELLIDGMKPDPETKAVVSYLPDHGFFANWMSIKDAIDIYDNFYADFSREKALEMCGLLDLKPENRIKALSKGNKEKVQLILVMSRQSQLYLLDEPIAGVDPAARDYILSTILNNYNKNGTILISTHLIADVERILDYAVFIKNGKTVICDSADEIREREGKSLDAVFREVYAYGGGKEGENRAC